ncbi:hypothetical protein GA0070624_4188 [Micromonospora rhizosphaerae]|uniref:Uncharacterized protein n=1 Tax=Micromonospora rhizosphaerae TaxID=568872 RepID=A0A1C6SND1_9ACTN|nr:hypothetical protein GA0070624_4188 [Micromonospora rhizosphaerae]
MTVSVTYQCTLNEPANVEVLVAQSRGTALVRGFGILFGFCSSSPQTSLIVVEPQDNMAFQPGPADARASDLDGGATTGPVTIRLVR